MLQIAFTDIGDRCHEVEIRFLGWPQSVVMFDTYREIGEIERYAFTVDRYRHLDVAHQITCFLLDPSSDLYHHGIQPCLGIGIESVDMSCESYAHPSGELL